MNVKLNDKRTVFGWTIYDWANSTYNLVITSTIFPIYYENITTQKDVSTGEILTNNVELFGRTFENTSLYSYVLSLSFLTIAFVNPILSGIADYSGSKKRFMQFFCILGSLACAGMYFFTKENIGFGLFMAFLASVGYSGSIVFYNAFLPEIVTPDRYDSTSARGFAMGYIGSVILLIFNLMLIMKPEWFGIPAENNGLTAKISFLCVAIWWLGFAQLTFARLPNNSNNKKSEGGAYLSKGYSELIKVWKEIKLNPVIKKYLTSFFIFNMGVQTVMYMAVTFAKKEITDMPDSGLIISILIIQLIAIAGAFACSWLSRKIGNIKALGIAIFIWIIICFLAYAWVHTVNQFYILAALVGVVMGGVQSLARSTYSKLLPETKDHASYFSFYDFCYQIGIVIGTFVYGYIYELTGDIRNAALVLSTIFFVGLILLFRVPKIDKIVSVRN
jgi:MFS transporter, UMF1 family